MRKTIAVTAVLTTAAVCVACSPGDANAAAALSSGNSTVSYVAPAEYLTGTNAGQMVTTGGNGVISQNLSVAINQLDLPIEFYNALIWALNTAAASVTPAPL